MDLKISICDDEIYQTHYIKNIVTEWINKNKIHAIIKTFSNAEEFIITWQDSTFDILLLDIEMGKMNGIELAKEIRKNNEHTQIIFITGFADYVIDGYDVSALHYLMKPVNKDKLHEILDKALNRIEKKFDTNIKITINRTDILIPRKDIIYIESSLNYIVINTSQTQYKVKMSLSEIETKLGTGFFKCTRSFIVNLRYVNVITKKELTLTTGITIPLSRGLYNDINDAIIKYF